MAVIQDLRYGLRALIRTPSVTAVAILTLTIGIGANTAAFSVIDAVLLRPLPFADAARLMRVHERRESDYGHVSGHEFAAWRDRNGTFDGLVAYEFGGANLTGAGDPQALQTLLVSARFFDVLGMHAIMGRGFVVGEDQRGANHVAVLSHRLWQRSFGSNPAIVGAVIRLDNEPYSVVGVMPPASDLDPDLWVPMDLPQELRRVGRHSLNVIGRLKPDKTPSEARADLAVISRNLEREMPDMNTGHGVEVVPLYDDIVGDAAAGARRIRCRGVRAADCLRQCGPPPADTRGRARARGRGTDGAWRDARRFDPAVSRREPAPRVRRGRARCAAGRVDRRSPAGNQGD
jgi:putative ABC transport system permease protein